MTDYDSTNVFARILRGEIPSHRDYEDEQALVIMDAFPQVAGHTLVIPKAPSRDLLDADSVALTALLPLVQRVARAVKAATGAPGIRVMQFNEAPAGQTVFHLHIHVMPASDGADVALHGGGSATPEELAGWARRIAAAMS